MERRKGEPLRGVDKFIQRRGKSIKTKGYEREEKNEEGKKKVPGQPVKRANC